MQCVCLKPGVRGFSPATVSVRPGYFRRKQKENGTRRTSKLYNSPLTYHITSQLEVLVTALG